MKKIAISIVLLFALFGSQAQDVTRIQLKVMQTRKFLKPPQQVVNAVTELAKDKGWICYAWRPPVYACEGVQHIKTIQGKSVSTCFAADGVSPGKIVRNTMFDQIANKCRTSKGDEYSFEFDTNYPKSDETSLRIRIGKLFGEQSTNPAQYSAIFKEIADGMFIDAIEINPAVQE